MAIGYEFITLDDKQKTERRFLLDHYSFVAQWSALVIPAFCLLRYLWSNVATYALVKDRPRSPSFNKEPDGTWAWFLRAKHRWDRTKWWMKKEVASDWGTRGEWLVAGVWTTWLLYLCIVDTGNGM
jgi:hypothetical protein